LTSFTIELELEFYAIGLLWLT